MEKTDQLYKHPDANCAYYKDIYTVHENDYYTECGIECGFMSYNTKIIIIRDSRIIYTGKYSTKTSQHVTWFLQEKGEKIYGLNNEKLKIMNKKRLAYNYITGVFDPLTPKEEKEIKEIRYNTFRCW